VGKGREFHHISMKKQQIYQITASATAILTRRQKVEGKRRKVFQVWAVLTCGQKPEKYSMINAQFSIFKWFPIRRPLEY
jgi:hypothetical protein